MKVSLLIIISLTRYLEGCRKSGDSSSITNCCPDYYLKNGVCVDCPAGRFGPSCQFNCEYPKYGRRCLGGYCTCSRDACDPAIGCRETTTSVQKTSPQDSASLTSSSRKVTTKSVTIITTMYKNDDQSTRYSIWDDKNTSKSFVTSNQKMESEVIKDTQKAGDSQDISLNIIIMSVIGGLVILLLIIVIIVLIRGKRKVKVEKRDSIVTSRGNVNTYCEINDLRIPSTSQDCRRSDVGKYELIDQSEEDRKRYSSLPMNCRSDNNRKSDLVKYEQIKQSDKERTKYSTLPSKSMPASNRDSYITPVPVAIQITNTVEEHFPILKETEQGVSEPPVLLRKASNNRNPNLLPVSDPFAASKSVSGYIDMNEGGKLDEYVPMEGQLNNMKNSDSCKSEEKTFIE
ncbi:uncharacterized protein LOC133173246 [Saccostrea echinata]|uniref:uncharacterized protein LOC133173246 n=1 Tax=Saccostrea echinata TaxID=191078 RepID=UPI002A8318ED|nr:uncharacterized protein LOC133173246 [Saccostrea echinata]